MKKLTQTPFMLTALAIACSVGPVKADNLAVNLHGNTSATTQAQVQSDDARRGQMQGEANANMQASANGQTDTQPQPEPAPQPDSEAEQQPADEEQVSEQDNGQQQASTSVAGEANGSISISLNGVPVLPSLPASEPGQAPSVNLSGTGAALLHATAEAGHALTALADKQPDSPTSEDTEVPVDGDHANDASATLVGSAATQIAAGLSSAQQGKGDGEDALSGEQSQLLSAAMDAAQVTSLASQTSGQVTTVVNATIDAAVSGATQSALNQQVAGNVTQTVSQSVEGAVAAAVVDEVSGAVNLATQSEVDSAIKSSLGL